MKPPIRQIVTFRLDPELVEGLQTVYQRDGVQPSEQVRRAVRAWLEEKGVLNVRADRRRGRTPGKRS